ncbi:Rik1-associated factor Raf2 [Schizosaccharomyces cryophilus OY26]|uniref:Rik1-associated factor Raf2 n=1 Tax=Schizosaccharomyces cryophilus (strain OY26 / ATCC MYA-4695 / CBS 11777 / NBRC 106824 / NRRL Y48691) TaxID=653667 RepID=S9X856_SCHCR|nr:Rik1-associated factor Raf2 [Schizosaccharomyces cryophilus OY26]EPY49946.1 Rik1-associated factor Raf2 [Schizosaccharomyces cryophilus OY26]
MPATSTSRKSVDKRETHMLQHVTITNEYGELSDLEDVMEHGPFTLTGLLVMSKREHGGSNEDSTVLGHSIKISPIWTFSLRDEFKEETTKLWIITSNRRYIILSSSEEYQPYYEQILEKNRLFFVLKNKFKQDMVRGHLQDYDSYISTVSERMNLASEYHAILLIQKHLRFLLLQMTSATSLHIWAESPFLQRIRSSYEHVIFEINANIQKVRSRRKNTKRPSATKIENQDTYQLKDQRPSLAFQPVQPFRVSPLKIQQQHYCLTQTFPIHIPHNDSWLPGLRIVDPNFDAITLWKRIQASQENSNFHSISLEEASRVVAEESQSTYLEAKTKITGHGEALLQIMYFTPSWRGSALFNDLKHAVGYQTTIYQARVQFRTRCQQLLQRLDSPFVKPEKENTDIDLFSSKLEPSKVALPLYFTLLKQISCSLPGADYTYAQYVHHLSTQAAVQQEKVGDLLISILPEFLQLFSREIGYWPVFSIYSYLYECLKKSYPKVRSNIPNFWNEIWLNKKNTFAHLVKGSPTTTSVPVPSTSIPFNPRETTPKSTKLRVLQYSDVEAEKQRRYVLYKVQKVYPVQLESDIQSGIWTCPVKHCLYFSINDNPLKPNPNIYEHIIGHMKSTPMLEGLPAKNSALIEDIEMVSHEML